MIKLNYLPFTSLVFVFEGTINICAPSDHPVTHTYVHNEIILIRWHTQFFFSCLHTTHKQNQQTCRQKQNQDHKASETQTHTWDSRRGNFIMVKPRYSPEYYDTLLKLGVLHSNAIEPFYLLKNISIFLFISLNSLKILYSTRKVWLMLNGLYGTIQRNKEPFLFLWV